MIFFSIHISFCGFGNAKRKMPKSALIYIFSLGVKIRSRSIQIKSSFFLTVRVRGAKEMLNKKEEKKMKRSPGMENLHLSKGTLQNGMKSFCFSLKKPPHSSQTLKMDSINPQGYTNYKRT